MNYVLPIKTITEWEKYTIQHKPISSYHLMEKAATACFDWIQKRFQHEFEFIILCGNGNNGGDGLVIARLLLNAGYKVQVWIDEQKNKSQDNETNYFLLKKLLPTCIHNQFETLVINKKSIFIDALFGTGLNKNIEGYYKEIIENANQFKNIKISIDIPSGIFGDGVKASEIIFKADYTLTFISWKLAFLFQETGADCGEIILLDIGMDPEFKFQNSLQYFLIEKKQIYSFYKKREKFSHKATYGHAALVVGSKGKMGAAVMSSKACLRSGIGLLTAIVPDDERNVLQIAIPEAMTDNLSFFENNKLLSRINAIGIGCGLSTDSVAIEKVKETLSLNIPLIIDADALNIIAKQISLIDLIPHNSLLTPHPAEFDRLFGTHENALSRFETQREKSKELGIYILLKGKYTSVCCPNGEVYFNINGNPGMAVGGSGDVLTGIITSLYAQYQDMKIATLMGAYIHGRAGDLASNNYSQESMLATDIIECLPEVFKEISADFTNGYLIDF